MLKLLYIFLTGAGVLIGALVLNVVASYLGLVSWYDFIKDRASAGPASYAWLFVVYPLGLGLVVYGLTRIIDLG